MNKRIQLVVALLILVGGAHGSSAVQIDPNYAGAISIRQIDNGVFGANASNASQLAFGPGPNPDRTYLYMSSPTGNRGVRRRVRPGNRFECTDDYLAQYQRQWDRVSDQCKWTERDLLVGTLLGKRPWVFSTVESRGQ